MYTINANQKCSVNITTNRNRVKTYGECVYLKDAQKFEIELFNPHNYKVLAKIKFNGHYISDNGLVLNPGQRVYLERYIDSNNAFIFSTYEIDGTTEALKAISENGNIEVEFYAEYIPTGISWTNFGNTGYQYYHNTLIGDSPLYGSSTTTFSTSNNVTYTANVSGTLSNSLEEPKGSIETGRVESGDKTNQKLEYTNGSFNSWASERVKAKILPLSAKPVEVNEIRNYCTGCGTRVKKASWKFCPSCGDKL